MVSPGKILGQLLGGLALVALGIALIFMNTDVHFSLYALSIGGGRTLSSGLLVIPIMISIIMLIAMDNKTLGSIILAVSLICLFLALILSLRINLHSTNLFNLFLMFGPVLVGIGLILRGWTNSLKK